MSVNIFLKGERDMTMRHLIRMIVLMLLSFFGLTPQLVLAVGENTTNVSPGPAVTTEDAEEKKGADNLPSGKELVNMDFPEPTEIKDIIKAIALWTGKNVILDRNVSGKVQIISPKKVTKEEAYQAFLSALNLLNFTTVETGKVIKIMKVRSAVKDNLKTYMGSGWAPRTDEIITQIIPLKYIDAKQIQSTLSRIVSSNSMIAYEPTNTLIVSDSGFKVRRILEILELLDIQTQQPKVMIVPIKNSDVKNIADKINEILKASTQNKKGSNSFKILTDERSNSIIIFGPPRTIDDIRDLVKKFDVPLDDPSMQATIHVRPLDYADSKKLSATLSSLASGNNKSAGPGAGFRRPPVSPGGAGAAGGDSASVADLGEGLKITSDDASNSLLITGSKAGYDALNTIIRKLDIRRSQVFVETDILDISEGNNFRFGSSIFMGSGGSGQKNVYGWEAGKIAPLVAGTASSASGTTAATPTTSALTGIADTFKQDLNIGILSGGINLGGMTVTPGALISMIKSDNNTRVLQSPNILTSNNEEAVIVVGTKMFFDGGTNVTTVGSSQKIEKEDIDLTLTIKPNVSNSNYITMNISLESNQVAAIENGRPRISKRKSKQIVTVKDGQTVVISGFVASQEFESYTKIPLLGDIPILGWLFRNSDLKKERTNLSMFITPHEINGAADLAAIYKTKVEDRDLYLKNLYGNGIYNTEFYKRLPPKESGEYKPTKLDELEEQRMEKLKEEGMRARGYDEKYEKELEKASKAKEEETSSTEREISVPVTMDPDAAAAATPAQSLQAPQPPMEAEEGDSEAVDSEDAVKKK